MEVAVVAEREKVKLQTLALYHLDIGDVADTYLGKVGLSCDRAQRREFGTVEAHPIIILLMLVGEGLQHLRRIVHLVFRLGSQRLQSFVFSFHT